MRTRPSRSPAAKIGAPGHLLVFAIGAAAAMGLSRCGAAAKQQGIETTLGAMSSEQRRSNFEDTARVLDRHSDWIDEFYSVARAHPVLLRRFLENATRDLETPGMAELTAELLVEDPRALEQVLVATVDAAKPKPEARRAIDRAVTARAEAMSDILTDDAATVDAVVRALLGVTSTKPAAQRALVAAADNQSQRIVEFVSNDPKLVAAMTRPVLEAAMKDKESLTRLLKELEIL